MTMFKFAPFVGGVLFVASCGQSTADPRIVGRWNCDGVDTSTRTSIKYAVNYKSSGSYDSDVTINSIAEGQKVSLKLSETGRWSVDGDTMTTKPSKAPTVSMATIGGTPLSSQDRETLARQTYEEAPAQGLQAQITKLTENEMTLVEHGNKTFCER